ncbi:MAG: trehalose operon repressor [Oscillospiraceae bacterium]|nr:trehalose operon repressor [Oscillospiraceae bacterium]
MPKSKFEEIYRNLKNKVEQGDYLYGELLPSENTLIGMYDCSRNTIRRALSGLVEDGYVQSIHGKGVQVIYQPSVKKDFTIGGIETFRESAQRNNFSYETRVIRFQTVLTDEALADRTGFPVGTELLWVERVRYLNGKALILDVNFFLKSVVGDLTPEIAEQSIYAYLEHDLGMQIVTSKREITVERAAENDRRHLDLNGYDCLAVVTSNTFNSDGIMFEYTQSRHQPEFFSFRDTATRKKS